MLEERALSNRFLEVSIAKCSCEVSVRGGLLALRLEY